MEIKTENQHLLQKVAEIQTSKGTYSHIEAFQTNKKSNLNIESRIRAIKNIMDANAVIYLYMHIYVIHIHIYIYLHI